MKITEETGSIPAVSYNEKEKATEFRFEGEYCDFSLFLKLLDIMPLSRKLRNLVKKQEYQTCLSEREVEWIIHNKPPTIFPNEISRKYK